LTLDSQEVGLEAAIF